MVMKYVLRASGLCSLSLKVTRLNDSRGYRDVVYIIKLYEIVAFFGANVELIVEKSIGDF